MSATVLTVGATLLLAIVAAAYKQGRDSAELRAEVARSRDEQRVLGQALTERIDALDQRQSAWCRDSCDVYREYRDEVSAQRAATNPRIRRYRGPVAPDEG